MLACAEVCTLLRARGGPLSREPAASRKVLPSADLLIAFEVTNTFQLGVGANRSPLEGSEGHTVIAAGWTPRIGTIYTPVHFFFSPDVDGVNRMGVTTGVTV